MAMARQPSAPVAGSRDRPAVEGSWCTVRVCGPEGAVDAALPADATVAEVVDELAARLLPGAPLVRGADGRPWYLHRTGAGPMPPGISLEAAGVRDGDVLHLGPWPMPRPAQPVDDGLVALAEGAGRLPRWTVRRVGVLVTALLVAVAAVGASLSLAVPGGPLVPLALAGMLLGLAALQRRTRATTPLDGPPPGADLPTLGAALASLTAWTAAGVAGGLVARGGLPLVLTLAGSALAVGAASAWLVVGERGSWWAAAGTLGAGFSLPSALVAGGLLPAPRAIAVALTVWLVLLVALPWIVTRSRTWIEPREDAEHLLDHAAATRRTLDLAVLAGSTAAAVGLWVLATSSGGGIVLGFCAAVAVTAVLRARRSVFVGESASAVGAGVVGLAGVAWAVVLGGGPVGRAVVAAVAVAVIGGLVGLGGALRTAELTDEGVADWWRRPRTQRLLGWLETGVAVSVLPLLAGVLGIYAAAADAGARF
ncbi:EsaB/YukD family protein [Actinomycetospora sp. CA-084318]|uniref:EsaB/YukD family protein n=1 Tax=Actinomycetospora sp. CA-084318 TaxID=3239892 RepID=UPI003D98716C